MATVMAARQEATISALESFWGSIRFLVRCCWTLSGSMPQMGQGRDGNFGVLGGSPAISVQPVRPRVGKSCKFIGMQKTALDRSIESQVYENIRLRTACAGKPWGAQNGLFYA